MGQNPSAGLSIFQEVLQSLAEEEPLERTLNLIARRVSELARFSFCGIILPAPNGERVHLAGSHGFPPRYAERLGDMYLAPVGDERLASSPTQRAMRAARTEVIGDVLADESFSAWRQLAVEFGYRSLVSVPLIAEGKVIGALNGYSNEPREYTASELATVEALAGQAALAVRLATLVEAQQETIATLQQLNEMLERHRSVLERAHEIHLRLTESVIAGAGFDEVADTLADLLGRPVAVADAEGRLICTARVDPEEPLEAMVADVMEEIAARGDHPSEVTSTVARGDEAPAAVVGQISIGAELLGYVVVESADEESTDLDLRAVEHAATVLALEIVKERVAHATEAQLHADFLFDLVNGRGDDGDRLAERARHYGLSLGDPHRVLVVEVDDWGAHQERLELSEEGGRTLHARVQRMIGSTIGSRFPGSLISQTGDVVTAAVPTEALADAPSELATLSAEIRRQAKTIVPDLRLSAGLGSPARSPSDFPHSHREALQCIAVLRRLGRGGEALAVDELGVLRLVLDSNQPQELQAFARRVLGPALERDESTGGALIETLTAYLDRGCDVRACAADLFVHANTVKYRLRRIEELCGLDLKNPSDMLEVTISQLVLRLTGPAQNGAAARTAAAPTAA